MPRKRKDEAAEDQVDDTRLLPGEDPAALHPDDALHWVQVYRELTEFKNRAMDRIAIDAVGLVDAARQEIESTDLVVLRAERDRFQRRGQFLADPVHAPGAEENKNQSAQPPPDPGSPPPRSPPPAPPPPPQRAFIDAPCP